MPSSTPENPYFIDQPFQNGPFQVRVFQDGELKTLAEFPIRDAAELYIEELLHPAAETAPEPSETAPEKNSA